MVLFCEEMENPILLNIEDLEKIYWKQKKYLIKVEIISSSALENV